jgi:hypothetical protein
MAATTAPTIMGAELPPELEAAFFSDLGGGFGMDD